MAYNSALPLRNQINIVNLASNKPQEMIDLGSLRFLCFVDAGHDILLEETNYNCIYFLA
jgi:hypothetical protein